MDGFWGVIPMVANIDNSSSMGTYKINERKIMKKRKVKLSMILAAEQKQADRVKAKKRAIYLNKRYGTQYVPHSPDRVDAYAIAFEQIKRQQLAGIQGEKSYYYPHHGLVR